MKHGKSSVYARIGCKCAVCQKVEPELMSRRGSGRPPVPHGPSVWCMNSACQQCDLRAKAENEVSDAAYRRMCEEMVIFGSAGDVFG